jgi:hypothetical protein
VFNLILAIGVSVRIELDGLHRTGPKARAPIANLACFSLGSADIGTSAF